MASITFWKRLFILNIGLSFLLYRTYIIFEDKINNIIYDNPLFPQEAEDGYPFIEKINCELNFFISMLKKFDDNIINDNKISFIIDNNNSLCSLNLQNYICRGNNNCFNKINEIFKNINFDFNKYHLIDDFDGKLFWDAIYEQNFIFNNISLNFVRKIISGYHSYVNIIFFTKQKNANFIKDKLTNSYENMNNLLYLYSLIFESSSFLSDEYNAFIKYNQIDNKKFINKCIKLSSGNLLDFENIKDEIIFNFKNIKKIINCIPNKNYISKFSSLIDIEAIITMLKIYYGKQITNNELINFKFFSYNFIKSLNEIFSYDIKQRKISNRYLDFKQNFPIIYLFFSIILLLFLNQYFVKNKEFYNSKIYRPKKRKVYYQDEVERMRKEGKKIY